MRAPALALGLRAMVAVATIGGVMATAPEAALAQAGKPTFSAKLSSTRVEVGEAFTYELRITTPDGDAEMTRVVLPPGLQNIGESVMQGGGRTRQAIVTWQIMAVKPGRYSIPGPPFTWKSKRFVPGPVSVEATASTGRRQSQLQLPGGISIRIGGAGDDDDVPTEKEKPELALPSAPDNLLFLRAVADKKTAVIGEQVTVTFYAYFRANFHPEESHDAPFDDFRTVTLTDPGTQQNPLYARAGQDRFNVKEIGRIAAFPLKAGVLHTGTAKMKLSGFRMGGLTDRESNDEVITVTEPPLEYRPPGYRFGDVGQFKIDALVQARRIDEGGAIPVLITVTGSGSFPDTIRVPERTGLEWLDPEKKEKLGIQGGTVAGWRSFGYVVRVKDTGPIDLGAVELSYWNPSARRYEVTRADLGKVEVTHKGGPAAASSAKPVVAADPAAVDPFAGLSTPRMALGAYVAARPPLWGEGFALWGLLAAPPLLVAGAFAGSLGLRKARERRAAGADSKHALAEKALDEAAEAEARGDTKALATAVERAIHLAVEDATGLRSRGVLMANLPGELAALGVDADLAEAIRASLLACESIRFDPGGRKTGRAPVPSAREPEGSGARDLSEEARRVVHELAHTTLAST